MFVRNQEIEDKYAATSDPQSSVPTDDIGFQGDTYLLPADGSQHVIDLPVDGRIADGVLELHVAAGAGQALDVEYIQLTAYADEVPVIVEERTTHAVIIDPYEYTYCYYYIGPWYRYHPRIVYRYVFSGLYLDLWFGWHPYRTRYVYRHHWYQRPHYYRHLPCRRPDYRRYDHYRTIRHWSAPAQRLYSYRTHWYRRHFDIDVAHRSHDDIRRRIDHRPHHREPEREGHARTDKPHHRTTQIVYRQADSEPRQQTILAPTVTR